VCREVGRIASRLLPISRLVREPQEKALGVTTGVDVLLELEQIEEGGLAIVWDGALRRDLVFPLDRDSAIAVDADDVNSSALES
jgi:hypothetical protein